MRADILIKINNDKKMQEYLKIEAPKIKERFKEMGFDFKR